LLDDLRPGDLIRIESGLFDVEEGKALYVGDFLYDSVSKKIIVLDNYANANSELQEKLPVKLEKKLAIGSKVKHQ
jgi:hypothetical protein